MVCFQDFGSSLDTSAGCEKLASKMRFSYFLAVIFDVGRQLKLNLKVRFCQFFGVVLLGLQAVFN